METELTGLDNRDRDYRGKDWAKNDRNRWVEDWDPKDKERDGKKKIKKRSKQQDSAIMEYII